MARSTRSLQLETRSNRLKLPVARKPVFVRIGPKIGLGAFGELHPRTLELLDVKGPVVGFEITLDLLPAPGSTVLKGYWKWIPKTSQASSKWMLNELERFTTPRAENTRKKWHPSDQVER